MTIKKGDLVMVVKSTPCCKKPFGMGSVSRVEKVFMHRCRCAECGERLGSMAVVQAEDFIFLLAVLKKIDPPAEGDSLPTRKDLEVPA